MDTPDNLSPAYYNRWAITPFEFIRKNRLNFFVGNIIKYIMRFDEKNGLEDLEKAKVYLQHMIDNYKDMQRV